MRLKLILSAIVFIVTLNAKTAQEIAEEAHIASINTLLIFTSQEGLNSGIYHFTNVGVDMEVYRLPLSYHFETDSNLNYFIVGNVGYSRVFISQNIDIPPNVNIDYDNHLRTYTGGMGGGIRYRINEDFTLSGGVEFIYSKSGASVKKPDDDVGDVIEDFFSQNYNDNLSYKLFGSAEYRAEINEYKPYVLFTYKLYETKSTFTFDDLDSFSSDSSVMTLSLGIETPTIVEFDEKFLTLEAYYNANYLDGLVEDVVQFRTYSTFGGVAYLNTPQKKWLIERYFLELNTVKSNGLEGYNVGVGFTLDF